MSHPESVDLNRTLSRLAPHSKSSARMLVAILFLVLPLISRNANGQIIPEYELGGASRPKPDLKYREEDQYKRVHQSSLRFILRDQLDDTEKFLNEFLERNPGDAETLYMLGILKGQRGRVDEGIALFQQALKAGLPPGRLIAGPREMFEPFAETDFMAEQLEAIRFRPVHGPLLGHLTEDAVSVWVRASEETNVRVHAIPTALVDRDLPAEGLDISQPAPHVSQVARTNAKADFTAVVRLDGLNPETDYHYAVQVGAGPVRLFPEQTFRTFAGGRGQASGGSSFRIAFGGGAGYVPENERMWDTIGSTQPDAILLLGDNVYIDDPESVVMQQYTYQRRQSRPEWRKLTASTPVYTIWDDHDFSTNDSWGGADIATPFWKKDWVYPIFRQNWANPGYGGGDEQPGCWYTFRIADVDFIMLDCRYYRTSPRLEQKSMLGPVQLKWLKQQLMDATGTFKVICSSVPWDFRTKGDSLDTWNGYRSEHEDILSFIHQQKIEGVVLMSADRHRSDAWKLARSDGYDFYEFNSSRLTNQHVHQTMEKAGAIFSFNKPQSFGLVTFDTSAQDPTVTYEVVDINGKRPHAITVLRSQLEGGY